MTAVLDITLPAHAGGNDLEHVNNSAVPNVWDTIRAWTSAGFTRSFSGYSNLPSGTVSMSNPGGGIRDLTQQVGAVQTPFLLRSAEGFQAPIFYTERGNTYIAQTANGLDLNFGSSGLLRLQESSKTLQYLQEGQVAGEWSFAENYQTNVSPVNTIAYYSQIFHRGVSASTAGYVGRFIFNENIVQIAFERTRINTNGSSDFLWDISVPGSRTVNRRTTELALLPGAVAGFARLVVGGAVDDASVQGVVAKQGKFETIRATAQPRMIAQNLSGFFDVPSNSEVQYPFNIVSEITPNLGFTFNTSTATLTVNYDCVILVVVNYTAYLLAGGSSSGSNQEPYVRFRINGGVGPNPNLLASGYGSTPFTAQGNCLVKTIKLNAMDQLTIHALTSANGNTVRILDPRVEFLAIS